MSYDTKNDTITVDGVTYDVDRSTNAQTGEENLSLSIDGEEMFEGLWASLGYEQYPSDFDNPRDWCNVGMMFCDYNNYILGDKNAPDPRDRTDTCPVCEGSGWEKFDPTNDLHHCLTPDSDGEVCCTKCDGLGEVDVDMAEFLRREMGATVIMPLYVYEHSGITMRAGAPIYTNVTREDMRSSGRFMGDDAGWDTSTVGFIFDTPEGVKQCIGENATPEEIANALNSEVEVYASYLEGDVTCYMVQDDETGYHEGCGGYVGCADTCESECFSSLEDAIEKRLAENKERAEMAARDIVTI